MAGAGGQIAPASPKPSKAVKEMSFRRIGRPSSTSGRQGRCRCARPGGCESDCPSARACRWQKDLVKVPLTRSQFDSPPTAAAEKTLPPSVMNCWPARTEGTGVIRGGFRISTRSLKLSSASRTSWARPGRKNTPLTTPRAAIHALVRCCALHNGDRKRAGHSLEQIYLLSPEGTLFNSKPQPRFGFPPPASLRRGAASPPGQGASCGFRHARARNPLRPSRPGPALRGGQMSPLNRRLPKSQALHPGESKAFTVSECRQTRRLAAGSTVTSIRWKAAGW